MNVGPTLRRSADRHTRVEIILRLYLNADRADLQVSTMDRFTSPNDGTIDRADF
jgi:hypothetical protein